MALAAGEGHRVVLVVATAGEEGEVEDGFLRSGQRLGEVRVAELRAAGRILGVARDSGMMFEPSNSRPNSFWEADVEAAAGALASILIEERADVLTVYDDNGGYGHPDHIQVHRVGRLAAQLAGTPRVFEATFEREMVAANQPGDTAGSPAGEVAVGKPAAEITTRVDVKSVLAVKEAAMRAHASQIAEDSWFLAMSPDRFEALFGTEWYIQVEPPAGDTPVLTDWLA